MVKRHESGLRSTFQRPNFTREFFMILKKGHKVLHLTVIKQMTFKYREVSYAGKSPLREPP